jgi:hypothetical protein
MIQYKASIYARQNKPMPNVGFDSKILTFEQFQKVRILDSAGRKLSCR